MSEDLEELKKINESLEKLNINIERLIGIVATQKIQTVQSAVPTPPAANNISFNPNMDIAAQVQAKIAEARAAAERQVAQARMSVPQVTDMIKTSGSEE